MHWAGFLTLYCLIPWICLLEITTSVSRRWSIVSLLWSLWWFESIKSSVILVSFFLSLPRGSEVCFCWFFKECIVFIFKVFVLTTTLEFVLNAGSDFMFSSWNSLFDVLLLFENIYFVLYLMSSYFSSSYFSSSPLLFALPLERDLNILITYDPIGLLSSVFHNFPTFDVFCQTQQFTLWKFNLSLFCMFQKLPGNCISLVWQHLFHSIFVPLTVFLIQLAVLCLQMRIILQVLGASLVAK